MKWKKKGLIFYPDGSLPWAKHSALTPTPILYNKSTIRIYAGFRDRNGVSRIGFVDVDAENPSKIIKISNKPVLDIGIPGTFDDNGMILGDILKLQQEIRMYYIGFQLVDKIKFQAFTGLAISYDNGDTFTRFKQTPIFERDEEALFIRAIHTVMFENDKFKIWYATGNGWENIDGTLYPKYDINYIESADGINIHGRGIKCIKNDKNNLEYRIGRPRVYKEGAIYVMNFTYGTTDGRYFSGQAESIDGINWERDDEKLGISLSKKGWDSIHLSYTAIISVEGRTFMFYNGNNMGYDGFGYAELTI